MRILTWNVNVLRTCLDYHPFSSMEDRTVNGLLNKLEADVFCFQEHKTRREQLEKSVACPGKYDAFWTFPRSKTGYSGVCTYVNSDYCVPLKAEEGITGLLLGLPGGTMRPPWSEEERVGGYPHMDDLRFMDEVDGSQFDPRRLDMEGRAVVCDFGLFVLFNLYCPNETNETRRPYKMNFFQVLQERVRILQEQGREVIIAGDINIMRAPIDSGDGGLRTTAEQHYEHPARRILDDWCAPKGIMIDVVRESWPDRDDMFTVWNQKLDARSANYGSRIDLILCTPGLRPWINGGDIQPKVYGSDHCPVYIDLHDEITVDGKTIKLKDQLNPPNRPPTTATVYPSDIPRSAPEPPRFATKFLDEFSGRQKTIKSFFARPKGASQVATPPRTPTPSASVPPDLPSPSVESGPSLSPVPSDEPSGPLSVARAAFGNIEAGPSKPKPRSNIIDLTQPSTTSKPKPKPIEKPSRPSRASSQPKSGPSGQTKLSTFFAQPAATSTKRKKSPGPKDASPLPTPPPDLSPTPVSTVDPDEEEMIAQAIAEADAAQASKRARTNADAAPVWSNLFAKKLPPLCTVHQKPCKDFIVKIPGPNKGKRFWLCSLPVGAGYDSGRSKRAREDVNHEYRCDFFLWDSANSRREAK